MKNFEIGQQVIVPEPNQTDIHENEFVGTVVEINNDYVTVEDGDGDCFDIEPERLNIYSEEIELLTSDILNACEDTYNRGGVQGVFDFCDKIHLPYSICKQCDCETPVIENTCTVCGSSK